MKRSYQLPILLISAALLTWACKHDDGTPQPEVTVTGVTLTNVTGGEISLGGANPTSMQVQTAATPAAAVDFDQYYFRFYSDNTSVFTVDDQGNITAQAAGEGTLSVVARNNSAITTTCKVTVDAIPMTALTIAPGGKNVSMALNSSFWLNEFVNIDPSKASVKTLKYTSSNPAVAVVDERSGVVRAVTVGSATIRVEAADNAALFDQSTVTVATVPVSSITINSAYNNVVVAVDWTTQIISGTLPSSSVIIAPGNASNQGVTYTSLDTSTATVDANTGVITGKKSGSTKVRVTTKDGSNLSAEFNVLVGTFAFDMLSRTGWSVIESSVTTPVSGYNGGAASWILDDSANDTSACFLKMTASLNGVTQPAGQAPYFILDLGAATTFDAISLAHRLNAFNSLYTPYTSVTKLTLYGSDDNVTYTLLQEITTPYAVATPTSTRKLGDSYTCRYLKANITYSTSVPPNGDNYNYVIIKDFNLCTSRLVM